MHRVGVSPRHGGVALVRAGVLLDRSLYRAADLATPNRRVCHPGDTTGSQDRALAIVDASSFVILSTPVSSRNGDPADPATHPTSSLEPRQRRQVQPGLRA
jgi:hypothetical protein